MAQAVSPPPDGGYPGGNTAEGQGALLSLTDGAFNTAVGSSGNPIVCFYQSNQISAHSKRKAKARFGPLAWINERREEGTSAAFPSR